MKAANMENREPAPDPAEILCIPKLHEVLMPCQSAHKHTRKRRISDQTHLLKPNLICLLKRVSRTEDEPCQRVTQVVAML